MWCRSTSHCEVDYSEIDTFLTSTKQICLLKICVYHLVLQDFTVLFQIYFYPHDGAPAARYENSHLLAGFLWAFLSVEK